MPLEILHRAAPCRNVPVTFTLYGMSILSVSAVMCASVAAGGVLGFVLGFSVASHADVLRGVRPTTRNPLVRFLARPTSEFTLCQGILFLILMVAWLAAFFILFAIPAVASSKFTADLEWLPLVGYSLLLGSGWLGRRFGAHVWWAIT